MSVPVSIMDDRSCSQLLQQCKIVRTKVHRNPTTNAVEVIEHDIGNNERPHPGLSTRNLRWRRDAQLGCGTYGAVHLETLEGSNGVIQRAVKEMRRERNISYQNEIANMAQLSQFDHFVKFYHWFDVQPNIYLAMEYLPLGNLDQYIHDSEGRAKAFHEEETRNIVFQLLCGLKIMHSHKICHRDLSLGNILVAQKHPRWIVKIADFGFAKQQSMLETQRVGTMVFTAPEIRFNSGSVMYDNKIDVWSVGCITFLLLTTEFPFDDRKLFAYYQEELAFPIEPLLRNGLSPEGCTLLQMLLSPKPEDRLTAKGALSLGWFEGFAAQKSVSPTTMSAFFSTPGSTNGFSNTTSVVSGGSQSTLSQNYQYIGPEGTVAGINNDQYQSPSQSHSLTSNRPVSQISATPYQAHSLDNSTTSSSISQTSTLRPGSSVTAYTETSPTGSLAGYPTVLFDPGTQVVTFKDIRLQRESMPPCVFCSSGMPRPIGDATMFLCPDCQYPNESANSDPDSQPSWGPIKGLPMHRSCALANNDGQSSHLAEHWLYPWEGSHVFDFFGTAQNPSSNYANSLSTAFGPSFRQDYIFHTTSSSARTLCLPFYLPPGNYQLDIRIAYQHPDQKELKSRLSPWGKGKFFAKGHLGELIVGYKSLKDASAIREKDMKKWSTKSCHLSKTDDGHSPKNLSFKVEAKAKQVFGVMVKVEVSDKFKPDDSMEVLSWLLHDIKFTPIKMCERVLTASQRQAIELQEHIRRMEQQMAEQQIADQSAMDQSYAHSNLAQQYASSPSYHSSYQPSSQPSTNFQFTANSLSDLAKVPKLFADVYSQRNASSTPAQNCCPPPQPPPRCNPQPYYSSSPAPSNSTPITFNVYPGKNAQSKSSSKLQVPTVPSIQRTSSPARPVQSPARFTINSGSSGSNATQRPSRPTNFGSSFSNALNQASSGGKQFNISKDFKKEFKF